MTMQVNSAIAESVAVLKIAGRFDAYFVPKLTRWLQQNVLDNSACLVIDLAKVNFIDSNALTALTKGRELCRQHGGDLHLCNLQAPVRVIFELTRADQKMPIFDYEATAIHAFEV